MSTLSTSAVNANEAIIGEVLHNACPECPFTKNGTNPMQCQIIQALRKSTLDLSVTADHPCRKILADKVCALCPATSKDGCRAVDAADKLSQPGVTGFYIKATAAALLKEVAPGCPEGYASLS